MMPRVFLFFQANLNELEPRLSLIVILLCPHNKLPIRLSKRLQSTIAPHHPHSSSSCPAFHFRYYPNHLPCIPNGDENHLFLLHSNHAHRSLIVLGPVQKLRLTRTLIPRRDGEATVLHDLPRLLGVHPVHFHLPRVLVEPHETGARVLKDHDARGREADGRGRGGSWHPDGLAHYVAVSPRGARDAQEGEEIARPDGLDAVVHGRGRVDDRVLGIRERHVSCGY
mmetsp:Transcript_7785/g.22899  ORF Transcript_7785/g.22899 Transcript_7785/m.22899 type:complete len:225 (+) Transcript_7785:413-1087(+)